MLTRIPTQQQCVNLMPTAERKSTVQQQCAASENSCMRHMPRTGHATGEVVSESLSDRSGCDSIEPIGRKSLASKPTLMMRLPSAGLHD